MICAKVGNLQRIVELDDTSCRDTHTRDNMPCTIHVLVLGVVTRAIIFHRSIFFPVFFSDKTYEFKPVSSLNKFITSIRTNLNGKGVLQD